MGIFLFENVEVLDFAGPYEVFSTASRVFKRLHGTETSTFDVFTVAQSKATVRARAGLRVVPDYDFEDHPPIDLLIVPGGIVTEELAKPQVSKWIEACSRSARITASICTGAFLLGKAGLLEKKAATTHWEDIAEMQAMFPSVNVLDGQRWVDEGHVVTSAGISAGIDMSLHLVARIVDHRLATSTARQMDFDWRDRPC
ncbi:DJ-1/PfpI family protein [Massilia sp. TSP1-1-2]|uniref:DJ-1/PfpI family protein n=1 Tax=Massilia sp. TSP1-1-2 TaxID=2804649 RepID=UPI003CF1FACB